MKLKRINDCLLVLIILVNGNVILAPLYPELAFRAHGHATTQHLTQIVKEPAVASKSAAAPRSNSLIIPSMQLDQPVLEGPVANQNKTLNKGIWRWPNAGSPDKGGNTVLIGHRFTYTNPRGVFYFLNKVRVGDEMAVFWSGKKYVYKVSDIKTVPPTDTSIEDQSKDPELTLFTCTPLWLPKNRLVVIANLEYGS